MSAPQGYSTRKRVMADFKLTEVEDNGLEVELFRVTAALNVEGWDKPALAGDLLVMG
jgi:hypothetical protein